jgi:hypothetical protein
MQDTTRHDVDGPAPPGDQACDRACDRAEAPRDRGWGIRTAITALLALWRTIVAVLDWTRHT